MHFAKYFTFLLIIIVSTVIPSSLCKEQVSFGESIVSQDRFQHDRPVNMQWRGFQDPIRLARERFQQRPRFSFRSADARPIGDDRNEETTTSIPVDTQNEASTATSLDEAPPCAGGSCRNTQQQLEQKRVELLKKTVLEKLKLSAPPNVTQSRKIPTNSPVMRALFKEYGIDRIRSQQLQDDLEDEIRSQKLISTAREAPFAGGSSTSNWFFFDFSPEERENFRVKSASIWYYIRNTESRSPSAAIELDVYRPYFNESINNLTYTPQRHTIRRLNLTEERVSERWQHLPVTSVVSSWLEDPSSNYGVKLFSKGVLNLIATGSLPDERGYKPFLEVQLVASHRRRKRSAPNQCQRGRNNNLCCLHDFKINFRDIGWDWIIFPNSYNARFCAGDCIVERVPNIHSTIVQASQDRHVSSRPAEIGRPNQPRSCCVPTKYAPLSMLYYDNSGNVVYSDVPDMEIRKCSCV